MAIEAPKIEWKSPLDVFEDAYAQELKVSGLINGLMKMAKSENDYVAEIMLQWFVTEQIEEENSAQSNVEKLKSLENNAQSIIVLDRQLGEREK